MSSQVDAMFRTFTAGLAIAAFLRVKLTAGKLAISGVSDDDIGQIEEAAFADLDVRRVRLRTAQGTAKFVAAAAITAGAEVFAAAGGKIDDSGNGRYIGIALEAASGNNSIIEVLRGVGGKSNAVEAHTADDTLTAAESGSTHTTVGAAGTVVLTLPPATPGLEFWFAVGAAQELRIDPDGTETISLPSTGVPGAAGAYLTANAIGETVHLKCCSAGSWRAFGFTGTWTAV